MKQLTGLDASFLYLEQANTPMHIGSIAIYDPSTSPEKFVRFKDILKFVEERLPLAETFRQKIVRVPLNLDHPYWIEDKDFDLEYHIRHIALPEPGDWRQLCILAARLFARPLDLSRPPWEITVIEGLDNVEGVPKGSFAFLAKVHHSAIDGVSGVDILNAIHTITPDVSSPDLQDAWQPERPPTSGEMLMRGYAGNLKKPFRFLEVARSTAPGLARVAKGMANKEFDAESLTQVPRTRFNHSISPHRVVEGEVFPLKTILDIKRAADTKMNDVMLAIVGGTMRKYLEAKDELPDESLVSFAPISVRTEGESGALGNQVSGMNVMLGSHIEDPYERLLYVHQKTQQSKAMTNALGARQIAEIGKLAPAMYTGLAARLYSEFGLANRLRPTFNTVVTNVPGPPVPIYSTGAQMVKYYGLLCLFDGVGLGHVVMSSNGEVSLTATACREMLPDPAFYAQCMRDAYDELVAAVLD